MAETQRSLLYVSPVLPASTGNGLAMRAGMVLRALAERYRVSLLVVSLYPSPGADSFDEIRGLCRQVAVVPPGSSVPGPAPKTHLLPRWLGRRLKAARHGTGDVAPVFQDAPFDVVHVFRLAALPFARRWLAAGRRPERHLDLDDLESTTRRRLAALYRSNGEAAPARAEDRAAERSAVLESEVLRDFDRVYVCSERDRQRLERRARAQLYVLPNALPVPGPLPPRRGAPFTFLFVGTLGYYPNEDAARHFCGDVLPLIGRLTRHPLRVNIVGSAATEAVRELERLAGVRVIGEVAALARWYGEADAVVVPVRAGGGTRIKVLEAFSYRRPVVSTSIGIEGIDALHGEHLLVGDTPEALAESCARLMAEPALAARLAERAFSLFMEKYTVEAVGRRLAALG